MKDKRTRTSFSATAAQVGRALLSIRTHPLSTSALTLCRCQTARWLSSRLDLQSPGGCRSFFAAGLYLFSDNATARFWGRTRAAYALMTSEIR